MLLVVAQLVNELKVPKNITSVSNIIDTSSFSSIVQSTDGLVVVPSDRLRPLI